MSNETCAQCAAPAVWVGIYTGNLFCEMHGAHLVGVQKLPPQRAVIRDNDYLLEKAIVRRLA